METIVVAIDFSKSSINALNYAIKYANIKKADIHMVWVDNISSGEVIFTGFSNKAKLEYKKNLQKIVDEYKNELTAGELKFSMRRGKVHVELAKVASDINANLMIAGTHGVTGFEEHWIGSNAYRIVTYAPCPVITVRNDFNFAESIGSIIFPIDSTLETKQKLPFTADIARSFNAEIYILGLYSTTLKSVQKRINTYVDQAVKYFNENSVKFSVEKFKPANITRSIINYAEKINADLITIMTEQENTANHVFLGPHAQQMINHSPIPILSLKSMKVIEKYKQ